MRCARRRISDSDVEWVSLLLSEMTSLGRRDSSPVYRGYTSTLALRLPEGRQKPDEPVSGCQSTSLVFYFARYRAYARVNLAMLLLLHVIVNFRR